MTAHNKTTGILIGIGCFLGLLLFWWTFFLQWTIIDTGWSGIRGEIAIDFIITIILSALISSFLGYSFGSNQRKLKITAIILTVALPAIFIIYVIVIIIYGLFNP